MADLSPTIETLENRWMRAWVGRDFKDLKSLTGRDFILLMGSRPAVILDRHSFLDAARERWRCSSFRFGDIQVRRVGSCALFASQLEVKGSLDGHDWSGWIWLTDLWRKRRIGGWKMAERVISRPEDKADVSATIKSMQLWK